MNILITGGTGLIGKAFIEKLLVDKPNKIQITILTRKRVKPALSRQVAYINSLAIFDNLDEFDAVINLQGEPIAGKRWSNNQKNLLICSRIEVTEKLSALINSSSNPPKVFISGSAVGFYGRQLVKGIDESFNSPNIEFSHTLCKQWEESALLCRKKTRVCIIRTGIVLSEHGGALKQMLPSFKLGLGAVLGNGKQYMPWIHIDDMVAAIKFLIEQEEINGIINLTAPHPATNREFSDQLASALNRPRLLIIPTAIMRILLGELSDLLLYGQHVVPQKLIQSGYSFKYQHLECALKAITSK